MAAALKIHCRFYRSSAFATSATNGDDRIVALLKQLGPNVSYLSGKGGASYQEPQKFVNESIALIYNDFRAVPYPQGHPGFLTGLSIMDALFHLGFEQTATMVMTKRGS